MHDAPRHAGRGAATAKEIHNVNTDLNGGDTFVGAPGWAENTDTRMSTILALDADPDAPHAPHNRRGRTTAHRMARLLGLIPPRHGGRRETTPDPIGDPDATVSFRVVRPNWHDYLRKVEEAGR